MDKKYLTIAVVAAIIAAVGLLLVLINTLRPEPEEAAPLQLQPLPETEAASSGLSPQLPPECDSFRSIGQGSGRTCDEAVALALEDSPGRVLTVTKGMTTVPELVEPSPSSSDQAKVRFVQREVWKVNVELDEPYKTGKGEFKRASVGVAIDRGTDPGLHKSLLD